MTATSKLPLRQEVGATVTPGDRLGLATSRGGGGRILLVPGEGTYVRRGHLYASVLGTLSAAAHQKDDGDDGEEGERWIVSVKSERSARERRGNSSSYAANSTSVCPRVGDLIVGRIARVMRPTQAAVDIVAIIPEDHQKQQQQQQQQQQFIVPLHEPFSGTLRQNEIRPNSSLEVRIEECVRPGDVILARIHANGERDFVLTTAEAELGVIQAVCESSGKEMRAVSWKEMRCPVTGVKEGRKVAKPRQR